MTQLHGKRLSRPGHGKVAAAVLGLVAALGLGAIGEAGAAPYRADRPHGSASPAGGAADGAGEGTGDGAGGEAVRRGSIPQHATGRDDAWGAAFVPRDAPRDLHAHRQGPAAAVPALVRRPSGLRAGIGATAPAHAPKIVPQGTGQDGSGTVIVYGTPAAHAAEEAVREPDGEQPPSSATTGGRAAEGGAEPLATGPGTVRDTPAGTTTLSFAALRHRGPGDADRAPHTRP
jgi:hypothetical protein